METYVVGTHKKWLNETLLMATHNIYFHGEIREICPDTSYQEQRIMQSCIIEKSGITVYYFLHTNICEYSLKATRQGTANDTHKIYFYWEIEKIPRVTFIYSSLIGTLKILIFFFFLSLKVTQTCKLKSSLLEGEISFKSAHVSDQGLLFPSFSLTF